MASSSNTTKDHDEIRHWAEERGGKPAHVAKTGSKEDIGLLRLEFPGAPASNDSNLEEISWEQFFEKFDERGLALLYQEETAGGEKSNFNKLVSSETADEAEESGHSPATGSSRKRSSSSRAKKAPAAKKTASSGVARTAVKKTAAKSKAAPTKKAAKRSSGPGRPAKKAVAKKTARPAAKKALKRTAGGSATKKFTAKKLPAQRPTSKSAARRPATKKSASRKRR